MPSPVGRACAPQALETTQTVESRPGAQRQLKQDTCLFPRKQNMGVFEAFPPQSSCHMASRRHFQKRTFQKSSQQGYRPRASSGKSRAP